ncbi:hypothetical protein D3C78_1380320 [compost metagenome]
MPSSSTVAATAIRVAMMAEVRASSSMAKAASWSSTRATYQLAEGRPSSGVKAMNWVLPSTSISLTPACTFGVSCG